MSDINRLKQLAAEALLTALVPEVPDLSHLRAPWVPTDLAHYLVEQGLVTVVGDTVAIRYVPTAKAHRLVNRIVSDAQSILF